VAVRIDSAFGNWKGKRKEFVLHREAIEDLFDLAKLGWGLQVFTPFLQNLFDFFETQLQWKPLNVIMVNVISHLLWSDCLGPICTTLQ
jgi:hypothetical protein